MVDDGRRCALPGCDVGIRTADGRPERRYCTPAHRVAARQARRAATQVQRSEPERDVLVGALPWLREPVEITRPPAGDPDGSSTGPVRRPIAGNGPDAPPGSVTRGAARRSCGATDPRRRRALLMIGIAGLLAGGYAVSTEWPPTAPVPAQTTPAEASPDAWARRADVALASVNRQLGTLAQAEEQWEQLPDSRTGTVPAPVAALQERRSVLQRRRATLQAQLDAYRSLRRTRTDLAASEQHLQAVEQALAETPATRRRGPEQEASVIALVEQRDLRIRRRDAQRAELESLELGVSTATRTPLPDDGEATDEVSREVLEVVRHGGRGPGRRDDPPLRPDIVGGREQKDGKPRQDPGTSGPPDPRGPRDGSEERRAQAERQAEADDSRDALAQLHAEARRVAREARRAEAERAEAVRTEPAGHHGAHSRKPDIHEPDDDEIEEQNAGSAASSPTRGRAASDSRKRDEKESAPRHPRTSRDSDGSRSPRGASARR